MTAYGEDLAFVHDAGFTQLAEQAAERLLEELGRDDAKGTVVELGCGSGVTAARLGSAGLDVIAYDQSPEMIAIAKTRAPRATFHEGSWVSAEIPPCDAVIAVGEVLNYQFDSGVNAKALERLFAKVFKALWPGGIFLFDMATPGRVPGGGPVSSARVGDDWAVLAVATEDAKKGTLTRTCTTLRKVGSGIRTSEEVHKLRLVPGAKVQEMLRKAGFKVRPLQGYAGERHAPGLSVFLARRP